MKIKELLEYASGGSTSAGGIASVASPIGAAPYNKVIKRMQDDGDYLLGGPAVVGRNPVSPKKKQKKV